jgi:hypothetical protein
MKIVNRTEFLKMPAGTIFIEVPINSSPAGDAFMVKGDTWYNKENPSSAHDFLEMSLSCWQSNSSEQLFNHEEDMRENGTSYPIDFCFGRNGLFDKDAQFLIYEPEDVIKLRDLLTSIIDGSFKQ